MNIKIKIPSMCNCSFKITKRNILAMLNLSPKAIRSMEKDRLILEMDLFIAENLLMEG
jgi:hypothetical protein